jgi:hypothetical protein
VRFLPHTPSSNALCAAVNVPVPARFANAGRSAVVSGALRSRCPVESGPSSASDNARVLLITGKQQAYPEMRAAAR